MELRANQELSTLEVEKFKLHELPKGNLFIQEF